ncbi:hypothetical protein HC251_25145 (plasmid) [Iamia sp. SCSIO 61187]|uniref:hypothetical protein n=1 Tax=Iamia sp. SCSIO 61187 TaxID=2722752 RepID=UPI001C63A921|nr:hypothetical protein [Iamia sp. SCSIO 61187]QYG95839.1 hypothetical protein HC251_25145 [Iamia sp. SCSIO 61187]
MRWVIVLSTPPTADVAPRAGYWAGPHVELDDALIAWAPEVVRFDSEPAAAQCARAFLSTDRWSGSWAAIPEAEACAVEDHTRPT